MMLEHLQGSLRSRFEPASRRLDLASGQYMACCPGLEQDHDDDERLCSRSSICGEGSYYAFRTSRDPALRTTAALIQKK
jgi:hypothetical protein